MPRAALLHPQRPLPAVVCSLKRRKGTREPTGTTPRRRPRNSGTRMRAAAQAACGEGRALTQPPAEVRSSAECLAKGAEGRTPCNKFPASKLTATTRRPSRAAETSKPRSTHADVDATPRARTAVAHRMKQPDHGSCWGRGMCRRKNMQNIAEAMQATGSIDAQRGRIRYDAGKRRMRASISSSCRLRPRIPSRGNATERRAPRGGCAPYPRHRASATCNRGRRRGQIDKGDRPNGKNPTPNKSGTSNRGPKHRTKCGATLATGPGAW